MDEENIMYDKRITTIREKVKNTFALAEDSFESASILYEAEKYRATIPLLKDSLFEGIKALLLIDLDEIPDNSLLMDSYHNSEIRKKIKSDIDVNDILTKLKKIEQQSKDQPLTISRESIKDLEICYKHIENFLTQTRKTIRKLLLTTEEMKKKKFIRKVAITSAAAVVGILVLIKIILWLFTLGKGLSGQYYSGQNFNNLIETRIDKKVDFDWGAGRIIKNFSDNVSIRWNGKIKAPKSGEYRFITRSDDGIRLWIDNKLIIDDWRLPGAELNKKNMSLKKGYHKVKIEYFEAGGGGPACMRLMWIIPGEKKEQVVSPSYLRPH